MRVERKEGLAQITANGSSVKHRIEGWGRRVAGFKSNLRYMYKDDDENLCKKRGSMPLSPNDVVRSALGLFFINAEAASDPRRP